jgi:PST family polysaccharide transporter
MFYRVEKILLSSTYKTLVENFISLSFLQVANYIFPLITLPYLVRVLGPEKYGLIAFSQAFIGYFQILTDYGFNLSATREISINRENKEKISQIFSSVMIIKFFLLLLSLGLMTIIVFSFKRFRQDWLIYYLTFGMVLGQTIFPIWFFQGMERMKYITFLNVLAKLIFTIAIFIFVRRSSDYLYVPLLNSLGSVVAGVLALWIVFKDFGVFFRIPSFEDLKYQLKEGWYIFISTVAISLYTISNTFILGLFTNNTIVGYYSAAEKIIRAIQGFLAPISQTIYPHISKISAESQKSVVVLTRNTVRVTGSIFFFLSLFLFVFAPYLVDIFLGKQYHNSITIIRILSLIPLILSLSTVYATLFLLGGGYKQDWSNIILTASLIDIILVFTFVGVFSLSYIGVSVSWVLTELYILIASYLKFRRFSYGYR